MVSKNGVTFMTFMNKLLLSLILLFTGVGSVYGMKLQKDKLSPITLPQTYHQLSQLLLPDVACHIFSLQLGNIDLTKLPLKIEQSCTNLDTLMQLMQALIKSCGYNLVRELFKQFFPRKKSICLIQNQYGETVLYQVSNDCHIDIAKILLDVAGDKSWELLTKKGRILRETALHKAHSDKVAKLLLDAAGNNAWALLTMKDTIGETALHTAVNTSVVKFLLNFAGDNACKLLTIRDNAGDTALHRAARSENLEKAQLLLNAAGNNAWTLLIIQNCCGLTALHEAADCDDLEMVKLLLNAAGDKAQDYTAIETALGKTAFDLATQKVQEFMKPYLLNSCCLIC